MAKFNVGDEVKVLDRPGLPEDNKIANWQGIIVKVKKDPESCVVMKAE